MESFTGKLAVVTGGGTGMGRELVVQLAAEGCHVAACDVNPEALAATTERALAKAPDGTRVTAHACDVADADAVERFRAEVEQQHGQDHVELVFNNAGVGGGGSFVVGERAVWERTFAICWGGVYNGTRSFLPMLVRSEGGVLVNTSSVNGFWATLGPGLPNTAYCAAKFAVKGFTESLIEDLRLNAPHVGVAVVMPGHIGTDIIANSRRILDTAPPPGIDEAMLTAFADGFRDGAPLGAAGAVGEILDGVRAGRWRILVGDDARALDERVRADPEAAYEAAAGGGLATIAGAAPPPATA